MTDKQIKKFFEMTPSDWENIKRKIDEAKQSKIPEKENDYVLHFDGILYHFETISKLDAFGLGLAFGRDIDDLAKRLSYKHEPLTEKNQHRLNDLYIA